jgi:hypothetical protein
VSTVPAARHWPAASRHARLDKESGDAWATDAGFPVRTDTQPYRRDFCHGVGFPNIEDRFRERPLRLLLTEMPVAKLIIQTLKQHHIDRGHHD